MTSPFPPPVLPPQRLAPAGTGTAVGRAEPDPASERRGDMRAAAVGIPSIVGSGRSATSGRTSVQDLERRDVVDAEVYPVVARPERIDAFRVVVAALGFVSVVLAWQVAVGADGDASETSLRRAALLIVAAYALAHTVFALWSYRYRLVIDDLRWRSPRRETWRGAWAAGWSLTAVAAASSATLLAMVDAHVSWYVLVGSIVLAVRISMLTTLGSNLARVVLGARRRLVLWGTVIAVADLLVAGLVAAAFVEIEPRRSLLATLAAWAVFALVDVGVGLLSYMKRVERWTLAWWLYRHEPFQPEVAADIGVSATHRLRRGVRAGLRRLGPIPARELLPVVALRYVVVISYWLVAGAALRAGMTVGLLHGELTLATDTAAAIDRLERSIQPFVVAVVVMQVAQGLWSVAQARSAQRATEAAPSALGMGALFAAGPAVLVYGLLVHRDDAMVFAALALLLNLACWVASFGALSTTIQDLGRSARTMAMWSVVVSLHWILGFTFAPLSTVDDDSWFALAVVLLSVVDAAIVVLASVYAWRAMRSMERAVCDRAGTEPG